MFSEVKKPKTKSNRNELSDGQDTEWGMLHSVPSTLCPWRSTTPSLLFSLIFVSLLVGGNSAAIGGLSSYVHDDKICYMCGPGTYVSADCTENHSASNCSVCPVGTFNKGWTKEYTCSPCLKKCLHDPNMMIVKQCTTNEDIKCACKPGYRKRTVSSFSNIIRCEKHRRCKEDEIVIKEGTAETDTECAQCAQGKFLNKTVSKCQQCSSCQSNVTVFKACGGTNDTVCNPSFSTHPKVNAEIIVVVISAAVLGATISLFVFVCIRRRSANIRNRNVVYRVVAQTAQATIVYPTMPSFPYLNNSDVWKKEVFLFLSGQLSTDWKIFIRTLSVGVDFETELYQISEDHKYSVKEQIYRALSRLSEMQERNTELKQIFQALKSTKNVGVYKKLISECSRLNENMRTKTEVPDDDTQHSGGNHQPTDANAQTSEHSGGNHQPTDANAQTSEHSGGNHQPTDANAHPPEHQTLLKEAWSASA